MLYKILSVLLVIAISLAGYFGYKYKEVEGKYNSSQSAYTVMKSDKEECELIMKDNDSYIHQLKKDLDKKPKVVTQYATRVKTVYEALTQDEKNILDADLPPDVIRLLDSASKDAIR